LEGAAAALLAFWLPSLMLHWLAREQLGFAWNYYAQLWAWGGVSACLSLRLGPAFLAIFLLILFLTWREIRTVVRDVVEAFRK
jgi:hypothetical protein